MARIVFPITFSGKVKLFGLLDAKNTDDGASSILKLYFAQQKVDMDKQRAAVLLAFNTDLLLQASISKAEKYHQQCVVKLKPIFKQHRAIVQMLKKYFFSNTKSLGDYGISIVGNTIIYPSNREELCNAIAFLINYSDGLPFGESPITEAFLTENNIDLAKNLLALPKIISLNKAFVTQDKTSGKYCQQRNNAIAPVTTNMRNTGNFLVTQFPKTPKNASDWGYIIDTSSQKAKLITVKFKQGAKSVLYSVVAGSIIQNTGDATLIITKGTRGTGTDIELNTGDTWKVARGYIEMTVKNTNLLLTGALNYMKH